MQYIRFKLIVVFLFLLSGCGNQQAYTAIQQNRQLECQKLPPPQYKECMQQHSESYDSYKAQREELLKE